VGAWLSFTPWAGRYLACRPAVPALVNVSPVKWALVKFTSLPANSAQTNVILPPTNLAPPGHAPLPQLAQSRPRPERHHLGLRAQVPGSTMLARGTGDWAARSRRCHGGHERLQRSLAPSCHAGIPLPQVTRQIHTPPQARTPPAPRPLPRRGDALGCWAGSASARGSAYRPLVPWPQTETPASKNARTWIIVRAFWLVSGGGQGQDRTADLPLFRSTALSAVQTCKNGRH
jgi:hypothetical protein